MTKRPVNQLAVFAPFSEHAAVIPWVIQATTIAHNVGSAPEPTQASSQIFQRFKGISAQHDLLFHEGLTIQLRELQEAASKAIAPSSALSGKYTLLPRDTVLSRCFWTF